MSAYLVLARKYRPTTFRDVVGQQHVVRTLSNSIISGRVAHAFLFCGVRGVGKTTVARILAKALNCTGRAPDDANPCNQCPSCVEINSGVSVDVQEIDGASNTSVENIRDINENIKYPPVSSLYKIIIIDEVHMISINAFNALLKTLEEPPPHAKFMFATTEFHKVPATINSRCQRFTFKTISLQEISTGMAGILEKEGITADPDALAIIAREAQGSFRDALSLLDQVLGIGTAHVSVDDVVAVLGITGRECFGKLMDAALDGDAARSLQVVHEVFQLGYDPEQLYMDLIQYLRNLAIIRTVPKALRTVDMIDAPPSEIDELEALAAKASVEDLQNLFAMALRSESEIKRSMNPLIAIEMMIIRMAQAPKVTDLAELLKRIDGGAPAAPSRRESHRAPTRFSTPDPIVRKTVAPAPIEKVEPTQRPAHEAKAPQEELPPCKPPAPNSGSPDEMWAELRKRIEKEADRPFAAMLEHGRIISYGESVVEIGFNKEFYKSKFEADLASKPEVKRIIDEFLGGASLKILTLTQPTPLKVQSPYSVPANGLSERDRAVRTEAMDNTVILSILREFEGSSIEDIKIIAKT
jgi:DNA polymerase III subunit gamma/tau